MANLSSSYSGVVINQNARPGSDNDLYSFGDDFVLQEFFLPDGYRRGTENDEIIYPSVSGLQIMVKCLGDCDLAEVEWFLEYQLFGSGWTRVGSGTSQGLAAGGDRAWFNIFFNDPVPVSESTVGLRMRFGVKALASITDWWYSAPNPLALTGQAKAYEDDGITPLTRPGDVSEFSFCFRVLGLTADEGVDFLGNPYRSSVRQSDPSNISTSLGMDRDTFWLSKPNPSKFAVETLYFDVRQNSRRPRFGKINLSTNPDWEIDNDGGQAIAGTGPAGSAFALTRNTTEPISGNVTTEGSFTPNVAGGSVMNYYLAHHNPGQRRIVITPGKSYSSRFKVRVRAGLNVASFSCTLAWRNSSMTYLVGSAFTIDGAGTTKSNPTLGQVYDCVLTNATAPEGAVNMSVIISVVAGANTSQVVIGADEFIVEASHTPSEYFDGDFPGYIWTGTPHISQSMQLLEASPSDTARVIDRMLLDPITPGAYFSIYYSNEGEPGVNEDDWEGKLWTRVPQTYRMERRETHVLPEPVSAKYIKLEFSHLRAQNYAPGDFQQPVRYKKHPKWVLDYFLARVATDLQNPFLAERIAVVYDALDLAYNYYLDDLGQEPQSTIDINNTALAQVTNFLSDRSDASDRIDPQTLDKISLTLDTFRNHPALRGVPTTILGDYARQTVSATEDYTIEESPPTPISTADVSSLNRDRVVLEQDYPVMFFFLTCRHAYREVEAKFSHDRAYFVGVRELAFLRDNYMTAFDTGTYIEPNADYLNIERNEFVT